MPLGPLIAVLVNTLDRYVDSKRILWMYRRPVPIIAQDIGEIHRYCYKFLLLSLTFLQWTKVLWFLLIKHKLNCYILTVTHFFTVSCVAC